MRSKNPVHGSGKKFRFRWKQGQRVPVKSAKLTKRERKEFSKTVEYLERAKALRPYFGDMFTSAEGYDLRDPDKWTPQQKAKVTRYYRVMAPRIAGGERVVKRYRRPDHLLKAIDASLQEERLPGQTAAVFSVDPGQELEIEFTRAHEPIVKRGGIVQDEFRFDKNRFLRNAREEVERVMAMTDANLFKIITGANRSNETFTRDQLLLRILELVNAYDVEGATRDRGSFDAMHYSEWLNGIIAFKGTTMTKMRQADRKHKKQVEQRNKERRQEMAKQRRAVEAAALRKRKRRPRRRRGY